MAEHSKIKKIAVIGGGISSLAAVFELTSVPDWQEHYEITVYQLGWRLGGKGASGRNPKMANRIEEHGPHFWWGFYDNAFRVIQACYKELNRSIDKPLATWNEAFSPFDFDVEEVRFNQHWFAQAIPNAPRPGLPGQDLDRPLPDNSDYVYLMLSSLIQALAQAPAQSSWWQSLATGAAGVWLRLTRALAGLPHTRPGSGLSRLRYSLIDKMLGLLVGTLWRMDKDKVDAQTDFNAYIAFVSADLASTMIRGMIQDGIVWRGFDVANEMDFREWLKARGAQDVTLDSFAVKGIYDMVFAYGEDGKPNLEAGTILRMLMRLNFTYKGAFMWRMQAGMGDTIFAPLYEVLKARGVTFKFFHRIEQLHLAPDGKRIETIDVARQVTLKDGKEYQPLFDVKGLPCWPSQPLTDQIVEGDLLKETISVDGQKIPKYNLESFWTPWQDAEKLTLKVEQDFDIVLLGTSLGALHWICSELLAAPGPQGDAWRNMMAHVKTIQTQAFQVWMKPETAGLGWPLWADGLAVMDAYDVGETKVDTWTDMSHLILRESWPDDHTPGDISYFCGPRPGPSLEQLPPPTDHEFPLANFCNVKKDSLEFLRHHIQPLWPNATRPDGTNPDALDWNLLIDLENRQGEARFDGQYWRLNADPTERYVLTLAGSTKYRLRTDGSGYDNLFLAGDWIYNGANAGCVESAVMSGLLASQAITLRLIGKASPEKIVGWPSA